MKDLHQSVHLGVLGGLSGNVCEQMGLSIGVPVGQGHCPCFQVGVVLLDGLHGCVGLLVCLCSHVGPLAGLCKHLWSGEVAGYVSWQSNVSGSTPQYGQHCGLCHTNTPCWVESQAVLPNQMVFLAGFCIQAGLQGGLLWSGRVTGWALQSGRPLAELHCWARLGPGSLVGQDLQSKVGWV